MDLPTVLSEAATLTVEDRLRLVGALWDSIVAEVGPPELTASQAQELERRLADHRDHPDAVSSWEVIRSEAKARLRG